MKKTFLLSLLTIITVSFSFAQNVAINADGSLPNNSAMLDVKSANKGILIPRVALTGTTDVTTIPSPATSLMVYNNTAAGTGATAVIAGYYYWDGAAWVRMVSSTTAANSGYKTLIPFASGVSIPLSPLPGIMNTLSMGVVGFGNRTTFISDTTLIDLTNQQNFSFMVPSSGTITNISATFSLAELNSGSTRFACRLYFASGNSNIFTPLTRSFITSFLFSQSPAGTVRTTTVSGLNIPVAAGTRILMVVYNVLGGSVTFYFSGGVNMVIQ